MANKLGVDSEIDAYPSTAIGGLQGRGYAAGDGLGLLDLRQLGHAHGAVPGPEGDERPERRRKCCWRSTAPSAKRPSAKTRRPSSRRPCGPWSTRGTASYYHDLEAEIGRPAAGKTGTSNEFIDAWFIGFIPQLSTSVWVGYPNERRSMVNINGLPEINGENYPLDIWSLYMQSAVQKYPVQQFDSPAPT